MALLTFADTHNMITFLTKSDASKGFNQIVDFMNAHTIQYALMVNPTIYVSCIKQIWASVLIKKSNDVIKLQALIDRKKCMSAKRTAWNEFSSFMASDVIFLATEQDKIAQALKITKLKQRVRRLEKKRRSKFFGLKRLKKVVTAASTTITTASPQLTTDASPTLTTAPSAARRRKGVDEAYARELEAELNKNIDWDEVIDHVQRKQKENNDVKRYQALKRKPQTKAQARKNMMIYLRNVAAQPQLPQHQPQPSHDAGISMDLLQNLLDTCTTLTRRVEHLEQYKIAQALEITKLKQRVKKLERRNKASKLKRLKKVGSGQRINTSDDTVKDDVSKQGRMIADMDADVDVILEDAMEVAVEKSADVDESAYVQGRQAES
nr:hypothetical protein [Tanacetum cinerariifolium]